MTWTYNASQIATSPMMQVRRLIGDVITSDQQIADEEINFALTQRPNVYGAAAECARYIAAQYSRKSDVVTGELKTNYSSQARAYLTMAQQMENRALTSGGGMPYAGGISIADKQNNEADTDRVQPQYNIGFEDNLLPVGPVGNETGSNTSGSGD